MDIAIAGDAFLEEFRPVRKKNDTTVKAGVPVYEAIPAFDKLRTSSPGGAAFLAKLLIPLAAHATVLLPLHPSSSPESFLAPSDLDLHRLPAGERQSRIEGLYSLDAAGRWRLVSRCDELYSPPSDGSISFSKRDLDLLIVDDHGRGAVASGLIRELKTLNAKRVIISAQRDNAAIYRQLEPDPESAVVVCTERQALLWTGIDSPPPRFPPGTPADHLSLFHRVYYGMRKDLPWAHDILVTCGTPLSCLRFTVDGDGCVVKYYGLPWNESDFMAIPGVTTFFLASLASNIMQGLNMEMAIDLAVSAAVNYDAEGVQPRGGWFGRLEELPPYNASLARKPSLVGTINLKKLNPEIWTGASNLLEYAHLHGNLPDTDSALPDYFVPSSVDKKIDALVEALLTFIARPDRKRPFNILVTASPGSGKSFFAQSLARRLEIGASSRHPLLEANLSLAENSDLADQALTELYSEIRDQRALGRMPVVLIDEFDSLMPVGPAGARPDAMDKLFARMLAPLWDGLFVLNGRYRRLGGFILLVAASNPEFLKRLDEETGKALDFASRIDVRLKLPDFGSFSEPDRIEAQVRMAMAMIKKHMGGAVSRVELAVLDAIGRAQFPRRNRAIDQLIMLSSQPLDGTFRAKNLPRAELRDHLAQGLTPDASILRYGESWIPVI